LPRRPPPPAPAWCCSAPRRPGRPASPRRRSPTPLANAGSGGKTVKLALTDPDSSATVPSYAPRFAGDFELTSQGDKEQIFVAGAGTSSQSVSVLKLSQSIDDTAWPSAPGGMLLASDNDNGTVEKITGPFKRGQALVAVTPCDAAGAPSTCPGPGFRPTTSAR
jgi:hypothetical protein